MTEDQIIEGVLSREAGFVDHPADKGGPTNMGITQATLSGWMKRPATIDDVKNLTAEAAKAIYRRQYVEEPGFPALHFPEVRALIIDCAVLHGPTEAIRLLQRALGTKDDGILGPVTLTVANAWRPERLILRVTIHRLRLMAGIVRRDPTQAIFLLGWINRAVEFLS